MDQKIIICLIRPASKDLVDETMENWITDFRNNLDFLLERFTKTRSEIRIVTDKERNKSDVWKNAAGYLVLITDTFLNNKDYSEFITAIYTVLKPDKDVQPGALNKLLRIDLSKISREAKPDFIQHLPAYDFFQLAEASESDVLLVPDMRGYWPKFLDLVTDLKITLQQYYSDEKDKKDGEVLVYLATTAADQELNRDIIRRELLVHGYRVYPDIELNFPISELRSYVQKYVEQSNLSIHLLGDHYGLNHPGAQTDITELQLQYVTEYIEALEGNPALSLKSPLQRFIWLPPDMKPVDERQEQLISQLRRDIEKLHRTDIMQVPLELFKTLIIQKLKETSQVTVTDVKTQRDQTKIVYLIHDKRDEKDIQSVDRAISSKGFQTAKINYENGNPNLINIHKEMLIRCDAALVYHHSGSRTWLMSKLSDLMKAPGLGREKPMQAKGILITGADPAENISFPRDTLIMRGKDPVGQLGLFIEKLK
jgi:hypothetical protein